TLFLKNKEKSAIVVDLQASVLNITTLSPANDTSDTSLPTITGATSTASSFNDRMLVDHLRQLQREYVHLLLGDAEPRPPVWLEEGLAQMFMAMKYDGRSITFAKLDDPAKIAIFAEEQAARREADAEQRGAAGGGPPSPLNFPDPPAEDGDFNVTFARSGFLPLQEMFNVKAESDTARNSVGSAWAKQCYAFVHYCLYSTYAAELTQPLFP